MVTNQNTIEQKQERVLIADRPFNSNVTIWQSPLCAWCLSEQGIAAGEGSHGICTMHAGGLLKQWRERGSRRRHQHF
jgi:hypothetical protein